MTSLPLTYAECRARFRRAAQEAGVAVEAHPIAARGPHDEVLTVDVVRLGSARPARALTILTGVHGVEGFVTSEVQVALLGRLAAAVLPEDVAVLLVHGVNPWGMAWWRRQNEHNVDLNRNWRRSEIDPPQNDAYDEVHHLACPDGPALPSVDDLLVAAVGLVEERGLPWVRDAITVGQYRHPDGLHYGGDRTEESNVVLERVASEHLAGVERSLVLDLHTGHGAPGEVTFLSDLPPGSSQDAFLRAAFCGATSPALDRRFAAEFEPGAVMATVGNDAATTGRKVGQIGAGIGDLLPGAVHHATSVEFGTTSDEAQLMATYLESWVHRHGDRADPAHAAVVWSYRCCFTPDDERWVRTCLDAGARLTDRAVEAVAAWSG